MTLHALSKILRKRGICLNPKSLQYAVRHYINKTPQHVLAAESRVTPQAISKRLKLVRTKIVRAGYPDLRSRRQQVQGKTTRQRNGIQLEIDDS